MFLIRTALMALLGLAAVGSEAAAADAHPGAEALQEMRDGPPKPNPVLNRFFLKGKRFEIAPMFGYIPNNPFSRRYMGTVGFGYHFNEQLAVHGFFSFAPDAGKSDVKSLAVILLDRANDPAFRQPYDKSTLMTTFGVTYAPVYGKINLLGETVVNFDFYAFAGVGMVLQNRYFARQNPDAITTRPADYLIEEFERTDVRVAPALGIGGNFFITQFLALKIDGKFHFIPDDQPVYNPAEPPEGMRLVTLFTASVGVSIFFPKMKPRLYDF